MTRVTLEIESLVLRGVSHSDRKGFALALERGLAKALSAPTLQQTLAANRDGLEAMTFPYGQGSPPIAKQRRSRPLRPSQVRL